MIYLIAFLVLIINIPFGFWRKGSKKFSFNWFVAVHLPVAISIFLRYLAGFDFKWVYLVLFVAVFIIGQTIGQRIKILTFPKTNV